MLQIQMIKQALTMFGVKDLTVKFEPAEKLLIASFNYAGKSNQEKITFESIEQLFQNPQEAAQQPHQSINPPAFDAQKG